MKKIIITSILMSVIGLAQAQNYGPNYGDYRDNHRGSHNQMDKRHNRMEQRENRRDVMELERDALIQRNKIDRAIYTRAISPEQANRVRDGYNRVLATIDKAKMNRRISDREVQRIAETLRRNKRELEMMIRHNYGR